MLHTLILPRLFPCFCHLGSSSRGAITPARLGDRYDTGGKMLACP